LNQLTAPIQRSSQDEVFDLSISITDTGGGIWPVVRGNSWQGAMNQS
jgi:hypothetical protein